jgi:hypothetical protein
LLRRHFLVCLACYRQWSGGLFSTWFGFKRMRQCCCGVVERLHSYLHSGKNGDAAKRTLRLPNKRINASTRMSFLLTLPEICGGRLGALSASPANKIAGATRNFFREVVSIRVEVDHDVNSRTPSRLIPENQKPVTRFRALTVEVCP